METTANKMNLPAEYELERVQILTMLAYKVYDGSEDSVSWIMRDIALFAELYPDAMDEAQKCYTVDNHKPSCKEVDSMALVSLGMNGLHIILTDGDNSLYSIAKSLIDDIDVNKEFSQKVRNAVFAEMKARAA